MEKILTYEDAYLMYEQNRWDDVMPFESDYEEDFVSYLEDSGYTLVDGVQII